MDDKSVKQRIKASFPNATILDSKDDEGTVVVALKNAFIKSPMKPADD